MRLLQLLNSPIPVAYFQYLCGVRWRNPEPSKPIYPSKQASNSQHIDLGRDERNFVILNRFLFYLAKAGTELAGEPFYYIFFPACAWIFQINIARRTFLLLSLSMFIGQGLKDILRQPRPASPPVIRLESMYETEYGMPSTHVVAAVTVSFSFLLFSSQFYKVPWETGLIFACCWSSCVIVSRIYLGMHTLLEVIAGTTLSCAIIYTVSPCIVWFDEFQLQSGFLVSVCVGIGCLIMARIMFALDSDIDPGTGKRRWNTARGDLAEILGWCAGFIIGSKYAIDYGILDRLNDTSAHIISPFTDEFYAAILRCTVRFVVGGAAMLLPFTLAVRKSLLHFFIYAHGFSGVRLEICKRTCSVELPYKFFSAFASGLLGTLLVPSFLQRCQMW